MLTVHANVENTGQAAETFQAALPFSPAPMILYSHHNFRISVNIKFPLKIRKCQFHYL